MRFVIQRVKHASVTIDGEITGKISQGFLVLIGIADTDTEEVADRMIKKMTGLRIFEDGNGKTNLSLADVDGALLLVSIPLPLPLYTTLFSISAANKVRRCQAVL